MQFDVDFFIESTSRWISTRLGVPMPPRYHADARLKEVPGTFSPLNGTNPNAFLALFPWHLFSSRWQLFPFPLSRATPLRNRDELGTAASTEPEDQV